MESLPAGLRDRARVIKDVARRPGSPREFVLYWMHHAVRGHENPSLLAAIAIGDALGLPVLVYQGLAGQHRFNSARHHAFILQGARDAAAELATKGVRHAMFVPEHEGQASPLRGLTARAAAVIVEEFPAPPFPQWTQKLAEDCDAPVIAVDAACVVPMQTVGKYFDRAFAFEKATAKEFRRRVKQGIEEITPRVKMFDGVLGFAEVDWSRSIEEIISGCGVDLSIAPVVDSMGGSKAGYLRWERFKDQGLRKYDQKRNDAAIDGVSRLSAYLHHGHVSPFRIAREASEVGGSAAEKFINELWVWRELAHNLCFHRTDELEELSVLPDWARATLSKHARDQRTSIYSHESLARGKTSEPVWNAAQESLLRQGELHNNLRMTWGKALNLWTGAPRDALDLLIDLNHRYALDGNNPNSYGGLLWCMGLFDRPFEPEQPVIGFVRPRPIEQHASRLDLPVYLKRVRRASAGSGLRVAIIGGGVAGAMAARTLIDHGAEVVVFDKGRGPGGRVSTRREGESAFDHGAQYLSVRSEWFGRLVQSWEEQGIVARWEARVGRLKGGKVEEITPRKLVVGQPGMNAVVQHLASDLPIGFGKAVTKVRRDAGRCEITLDDGAVHSGFTQVITAIPPEQAKVLLEGIDAELTQSLGEVRMLPSWTVMAAIDGKLAADWEAVWSDESGEMLAWIARDETKPGRRDSGMSHLVLQASSQWSQQHLEMEAAEVARRLLARCEEITGASLASRAMLCKAHRWRYGLVEREGFAMRGYLGDPARGVLACGDWTRGRRIEDAALSGAAGGGRLLLHHGLRLQSEHAAMLTASGRVSDRLF